MTKTWEQLLGIDSVDGQVQGSTSDTAKVNATNPRSDEVAVSRVSGEYTDQSEPHPDQRRGGVPGTPIAVTLNTEVDHDGYMGRGSGTKTVDARWTDR